MSQRRQSRSGGSETQASTPERQPRPKSTIPLFPAPRHYGLPLFTEADWEALEAVGKPTAQRADGPDAGREQELVHRFARLDDPRRQRTELVGELNHAFEEALWHAAHDAAVPKPSDHRRRFTAVAEKARELLHLLGLDEQGQPADRAGQAQHTAVADPWHLWLMRGAPMPSWPVEGETAESRAVRQAASQPFWQTAELAQQLLPPGAAPPRSDNTLEAWLAPIEVALSPEEQALNIAHWRIEEALKVAPVALALLARLAEGTAAAPVTPTATPEFKDTFRRLLFANLARAYVAMFGTAPQCWKGRHDEGNEGSAAKWAALIVRFAKERARRHLLPDGVSYRDEAQRKRALDAINDLAASELSTFAHRMERAWECHRARASAPERNRAGSRE